MIQGDVVADFSGFAYDHSHAVVDEKTPADGGAGMNFDAGQKAADMRHQSPQPAQVPMPQPIRDAVNAQRMEPRIAGDNLPGRARSRIAIEYAGDVFADVFKY